MIHNVALTSAPASAARRVPLTEPDHARSARPQPAADSDAAVVELEHGNAPVAIGGFGLDLAYSRHVIRTPRGQAPQVLAEQSRGVSLEFRFATQALPRGEDGEVDVDALANTEEKAALSDAIARIASEGLRDPGALASFVDAVDDLFGEYERDLSMSEGDLAQAKAVFVDEVKGFFEQVEAGAETLPNVDPLSDPFPNGFASLGAALESLRERLMSRRQDVLTAAGDLSKVLAELTAAAEDAPSDTSAEKRAAGRLGEYLHGMKAALAHRSTQELREGARERLLETDAEIADRGHRTVPSEDAVRLGRTFVQFVHAA
jgi:hypothetical protein